MGFPVVFLSFQQKIPAHDRFFGKFFLKKFEEKKAARVSVPIFRMKSIQ
jgi:hypothetical protein